MQTELSMSCSDASWEGEETAREAEEQVAGWGWEAAMETTIGRQVCKLTGGQAGRQRANRQVHIWVRGRPPGFSWQAGKQVGTRAAGGQAKEGAVLLVASPLIMAGHTQAG